MTQGISCYIHIPFCKSKCAYCDFFSKSGCEGQFEAYVDSLCNEIKFYSSYLDKPSLNSFYIGGGTPSLLSIIQLKKILSCLEECFPFNQDYEGTIELNPDDVNESLIDYLNESSINRISVGIQSFKQNTLKLMNRRADRNTAIDALRIISSRFTKRFSADLISGFPGESYEDIRENIDLLSSFKPEHISFYSLCVEEGTRLYDQINSSALDFNPDLSDELWLKGKNYLQKKGYFQYEISNFAKDIKSQSRHNLVYWHLKNYLGFGSGATGTIFNKNEGLRIQNTNDIDEYIEFWKIEREVQNAPVPYDIKDAELILKDKPLNLEFLTSDICEFEFFMMNFRLREGISRKEYENRFGKSLDQRLGKNSCHEKQGIFFNWIEKGLSEIIEKENDVYYRLTDEGLLYLNNFLEQI